MLLDQQCNTETKMATSLASDSFYEFACTPCSEEDINIEASVYCVNCKEYFCKSCFKFHNRVAEANRHGIVDKADFKDGVKMSDIITPSDILTEKCSRHQDMVVNMYCADHDDIGCHVCIAVGHRSCKNVSYIPDIAGSMISDKSIQKVKQDLYEHIRDLSSLKQERFDNKARLTNEKEASLAEIDGRMEEIIKYVRTQRTALKKDVIARYEEFADKLDDDKKVCNESIESLESIDKRLQTSVGVNTTQAFVALKRAEALMKDSEVTLKACKGNRNGLNTITFEAGNDVKDVLSPETVFGRLHTGHITPTIGDQTESINVKIKSDESVCCITDICSLPDGTIIITDWNNKKLKSLQYDSDTYRVSDSLSLSGYPWGVCSLDGTDVAVTVPVDCLVHVVSVGKTMSIRNSFKVDCMCYGIAYSDRRLYVGHFRDAKLTVYNLQGNCLQTISTDHTGASVFGEPLQLCVLPKHRKIAVVVKDKGVVVIDMAGNLVTRYTYPNMKRTRGVCVDDIGTMYIADFESREIVVLGVRKSVTTMQTKIGLGPLSVSYDTCTNSLLVTYKDSDHIQKVSIVYYVLSSIM